VFALIALIVFVVAQFRSEIVGINLTLLGLTFLAAHMLVGAGWPWVRRGPG
jgi:hypothetical protein